MSRMFNEPSDEDGRSPVPSALSKSAPLLRQPRQAPRPVLPVPHAPQAAQAAQAAQAPRVQIGDDFWGEVRANALPWLRQQWAHLLKRWRGHTEAETETDTAQQVQANTDLKAEMERPRSFRWSAILTSALLLALLAGLVFSVRYVRGLSGTVDPAVPDVGGNGGEAGISAIPTAVPSPVPTYTLMPSQNELAPTATPLSTATPPPKPPVFTGTVTLIYLGSAPAAGYVFVTGCGGDFYVCYCTNQRAPGGWIHVFFPVNGSQDISCTVDFSKVQNFPPPYPDFIPVGSFNNDAQLSSSPGAPPTASAPTVYWQNDQPFQKQ